MRIVHGSAVLLAAGLAAGLPAAASAQAPDDPAPAFTEAASSPVQDADSPTVQVVPAPVPEGGIAGYFAHWFDRVREAQESQPHWITPLVTVTPRLEQEVRSTSSGSTCPRGPACATTAPARAWS